MTELGMMFNKYGCDKASKHCYDHIYHPNLMHLRDQPINLLEVGVFKGASTRAWLEYFPNATIYGIDTFQRVAKDDLWDLTANPRVKLLKFDSRDPDVVLAMQTWWGADTEFDVIIDDGLHTPAANTTTFVNLWPTRAKGGMYFVEDVWPLHLMNREQMQHPWIKQHAADYTKDAMQRFLNVVHTIGDTTVIEHDLRKKSGEPDSYIIKVT